MDRRSFTSLLPALIAAGAMMPELSSAQPPSIQQSVMGQPTPGPNASSKPKGDLPQLISGVYTPSAAYGSQSKHKSRRYLVGMLKAGNIQMEIHETTQEPGAPHEAVEKHLHNEIWLVQEGICELTTNGVTRRMQAGDVGLCCAGDLHYVKNAGSTPCKYFVVTVGPPEHEQ